MPDLKQFDDLPDSVASDDFSSAKRAFADIHAQGEDYVREFPAKSVLFALGAGFILRLLPIGALLGVIVRLALFLARPALFIYGAVTLYKKYTTPPEEA